MSSLQAVDIEERDSEQMPNYPWYFQHRQSLSSQSQSTAQFYLYDDFVIGDTWMATQPVGSFPGNWTCPNGTVVTIAPTGTQNGIVQVPAGSFLNGNFIATIASNLFPVTFANIAKIVFRSVFRMTSAATGGESVVGFTSSGSNALDAASHLYGAFINFCPNWGQVLSDWDTRATIPAASMTGFTYGIYNGSYPANFGYKLSTLVTSLSVSTWYDTVISMIPGVSCTFYVAPYGQTPAFDAKCTVVAQIPSSASYGSIPVLGCNATYPGVLQVDKVEYGIWLTEGNKQLGAGLINF